jgi:hypothetical protein
VVRELQLKQSADSRNYTEWGARMWRFSVG